jgi:phage FluMu protein Com
MKEVNFRWSDEEAKAYIRKYEKFGEDLGTRSIIIVIVNK